jgi:hypothetical protein
MPLIGPYDMCLINLEQDISPGWPFHLSKETALERLRRWTGQDFGYDAAKWRKWRNGYRSTTCCMSRRGNADYAN